MVLVAGEGPSYEMHNMIEGNYHVRLGFPKIDGNYQLRVVGKPMNILKAIDFIGKLADDNYIRPASGQMKKNPNYQYDREKKFCCAFCHKLIKYGIISHCESKHPEEPAVAEILALDKKSEKRNRLVTVNQILFYFVGLYI